MGAESRRDLSDLGMSDCMVCVLEELGPSADAITVLSRVSQIEMPLLQSNGNVRRMIFCGKCTLVSVIEHDIDFNLVDYANPVDISNSCIERI